MSFAWEMLCKEVIFEMEQFSFIQDSIWALNAAQDTAGFYLQFTDE